MVDFPPLAPSVGWFALYLKEFILSGDIFLAIRKANSGISSPKEFGRLALSDSKGGKTLLSVAIDGGGRQLRTLEKIPRLRLSEHGDWRLTHLGGIESILGRKPFYREYEKQLKEIYLDKNLQTLEEFNSAIFRFINSFLMENIPLSSLVSNKDNKAVKERGTEIAEQLNPELSMIQALATHGKETLLGILAF